MSEHYGHDRGPWRATFQPKRIDTLRPKCLPYVGKEFIVEYAWHQDDDESYPGQPVFMAREYDLKRLGWIPLEDLANMQEMSEQEPQ